jgi:hypothetical protein
LTDDLIDQAALDIGQAVFKAAVTFVHIARTDGRTRLQASQYYSKNDHKRKFGRRSVNLNKG